MGADAHSAFIGFQRSHQDNILRVVQYITKALTKTPILPALCCHAFGISPVEQAKRFSGRLAGRVAFEEPKVGFHLLGEPGVLCKNKRSYGHQPWLHRAWSQLV